ncbi:MAG: DUF1439 domain-containing protein [Candidatus Sericytochromatia bacterium]|nr:DUF1439 domain-containing protein [Candidatus Sericytochromatia bacterium]
MHLLQPLQRVGLSALLCLSLASCFNDQGLEVRLGEGQIEAAMGRYLPIEKDFLFGQFGVAIQSADLILTEGSDRAEMLLSSQVRARSKVWPGNIKVSFALDYDPAEATFYLIEPRIEKVNIAGLPATVSDSVTQYVLPLIQQLFTRVPVYTLDENRSTGQNVAKKTLKKIAVQNKQLVLQLGLPE